MKSKLFLRSLSVQIAIMFGLCMPAMPSSAASTVPVVLSTDVGNEIDDQWAITYLLLQPRFQVLGILSAHAPSLPAPAAHTSYRILTEVVEQRLGMRVHPPLLEGSSLPLLNVTQARPSAAATFLVETSRGFSNDRRLTVLVIGAATDVASAILLDPAIVDRIRIVQMGFNDEAGGDEYNILNDIHAEQVLLASTVPLIVGPAKTCRSDLAMSFDHAKLLLAGRGVIGDWLWQEYQAWYYRTVKPLRVDDFSKPWFIWDIITLAYVLDMTEQHTVPRQQLGADARFLPGRVDGSVTWITRVDSQAIWADFARVLDQYQRTHAIHPAE